MTGIINAATTCVSDATSATLTSTWPALLTWKKRSRSTTRCSALGELRAYSAFSITCRSDARSIPHVFIRPVEIKRSAPPPRIASASDTSGSKSVFVSNLPTDGSVLSIEALQDAFGHCGSITNVVRGAQPQRILLQFIREQRLLTRDDGSLRGLAHVTPRCANRIACIYFRRIAQHVPRQNESRTTNASPDRIRQPRGGDGRHATSPQVQAQQHFAHNPSLHPPLSRRRVTPLQRVPRLQHQSRSVQAPACPSAATATRQTRCASDDVSTVVSYAPAPGTGLSAGESNWQGRCGGCDARGGARCWGVNAKQFAKKKVEGE
jgi:hypothetical protein